jgi:uncharacterized RDD family membrane protein YckC
MNEANQSPDRGYLRPASRRLLEFICDLALVALVYGAFYVYMSHAGFLGHTDIQPYP